MRGRVLVDTNLLVLLTVGTASTDFIATHKRTSVYTVEDFDLLTTLLAEAEKRVTTPNILSETSNLIRQFRMPGRAVILDAFRRLVVAMPEIHVPSADAVARQEFERLGLTDCATIAAQGPDVVLLTDDLELFVASIAAGCEATNFTHERQRWFG